MGNDNHPRLRVAIIGGGLAGATLLHSLLKFSHLDLDIYESSPAFSERGAAVGLSSNAQAALNEIGGKGMMDLLERAGAVRMNSTRFVIGSGPHAGEVLIDLAKENQSLSVHRSSLLNELLKPVPREIMHVNKTLTSILEHSDGPLTLTFQDGTVKEVDALIGADGIRGFTREHILTPHPSAKATFAGFWDCRILIPIQKAREVLGEEFFMEDRRYGWCGEGGYFMHDVLDDGEMVQCVASAVCEDWGAEEWKRDLDSKTLGESFEGWTNSPIAAKMMELLLLNPNLRAYPQYHHKIPAPTFSKGRICIIGDAAHATTPWHGAGAGQAIEDAMILHAILKEVTEPQQFIAAFKAYDESRRPRSQRIVESSVETGKLMCGRGEGVGLDPMKMRRALGPRWGFIFGIDVEEHKRGALERFEGLKGEL